jgi:hypothetical protein
LINWWVIEDDRLIRAVPLVVIYIKEDKTENALAFGVWRWPPEREGFADRFGVCDHAAAAVGHQVLSKSARTYMMMGAKMMRRWSSGVVK